MRGVELPKGITFEQAMELSVAWRAILDGDHTKWNAIHNRIEGMPAIQVEQDVSADIQVNVSVNNLPTEDKPTE